MCRALSQTGAALYSLNPMHLILPSVGPTCTTQLAQPAPGQVLTNQQLWIEGHGGQQLPVAQRVCRGMGGLKTLIFMNFNRDIYFCSTSKNSPKTRPNLLIHCSLAFCMNFHLTNMKMSQGTLFGWFFSQKISGKLSGKLGNFLQAK